MNIANIWSNYGETISSTLVILIGMAPFVYKRIVSDSNMIKTFDNIKNSAKTINLKQVDIDKVLDRIDYAVTQANKTFESNQKMIEQTILEFAESDFVHEMRQGVSLMKEFKDVLSQKDNTIQALSNEIKSIKLELQIINNKEKMWEYDWKIHLR